MSNIDKEEKELTEYLQGDSALSKDYRASSTEEPAAYLDEKVLSAANAAVAKPVQKPRVVFRRSPWALPVSMAAVITLSVSLIVTMQQETGQPLISEPKTELFDTAIIEDEADAPSSAMMDETPSINEAEVGLSERRDRRMESKTVIMNDVDMSQAKKKSDIPEAIMRKNASEKSRQKEEVFSLTAEEGFSADISIQQSAPLEATADMMQGLKKEHQITQEEKILLEIKKLWVAGEFDNAKQSYEAFIKNNPEFSIEDMKAVLGTDVYQSLTL